jgi:hypothetical protein
LIGVQITVAGDGTAIADVVNGGKTLSVKTGL